MSVALRADGAAVSVRYDVAIVGLGPVGAVLAGLLGQQGLAVLVIDRADDVYPLPRAAHFDHEIMRIFQSIGVANAVLNHCRVASAYEFRNAQGDLLMVVRSGNEKSTSGWAWSYMFNQPGVEQALRTRLAQLPNVAIRLGLEFKSLSARGGHVEFLAADEAGRDERFEAAYLVGCDGAWSPVREALGVGLEDYQFDEPWLVVDTIPNSAVNLPELNLQICDPARPTTCVQMGPGRHRWEFMLLPGEDQESVLQPGFVEALLDGWGVDVTIERKAVYRFHGLIAARWRTGRVLIAGDAAHQMPPFAGQGMCSGIRDAANLAWKLVAVLRDGATDALLDTYQPEREPSVRDYIGLAIGMGRTVCTLDPAIAAKRDAQMMATLAGGATPPPSPVGAPGRDGGAFRPGDPCGAMLFPQFTTAEDDKLDDALGGGAWLIDRAGGGAADGLHHISIADPALAPFHEAIEAWLADVDAEAVLVRPDRYVFGAGDSADLLQAWRAALADAPPALRGAA